MVEQKKDIDPQETQEWLHDNAAPYASLTGRTGKGFKHSGLMSTTTLVPPHQARMSHL